MPIAVLIMRGAEAWLVAGLLVVCGATDWFDGQVARWTRTATGWGKVLDPIADKIAVLTIGVALILDGLLPLWFVGVIAVRDILIVAGGTLLMRGMGKIQASLWLGKAAVTAAGITFFAAVLRADAPVMQFCLWATVTLMVLSLVQYLLRYLKLRSKVGPTS